MLQSEKQKQEFSQFTNSVFEFIPETIMDSTVWDGDGEIVEAILLRIFSLFVDGHLTLENCAQALVHEYWAGQGKMRFLSPLPEVKQGDRFAICINDVNFVYVVLYKHKFFASLRLTSESELVVNQSTKISTPYKALIKSINVSYPDLFKILTKVI